MTAPTHEPQCLEVAKKLEECFNVILKENMEGIQILNRDLIVEAVEFQVWEGRTIGMIISPWLISLVILPIEGDDWENRTLGENQQFHSRNVIAM